MLSRSNSHISFNCNVLNLKLWVTEKESYNYTQIIFEKVQKKFIEK